MLTKLSRHTLTDQAVDILAEYIEAKNLSPGDILPSEARLASSLGVSRPVIREALRSLEGKGIVDIVNGKGAVIKPVDSGILRLFFERKLQLHSGAIRELIAVRKALEVESARLAARHRTEDDVARLSKLVGAMRKSLHENNWSTAQIEGLKSQFETMGIEVIAVTDAGFRPDRQVADIERVLLQKPDIIISIPTDPVVTADAYKAAAAMGVHLVFMDNVPAGMEQGKEYVSVVSADNYGNGMAAAHLMAQALGGAGQIGIIYHAADFFVTRQRYEAFKETIQENYSEIEIVEEQGIEGPDFAGDAEEVASRMLAKHAELDGIWAVWDVPAEGVMGAARAAGREELVITTADLRQNVAISIAQGGLVKGLGAQRPFDQGVTEAKLAGYALLGKPAPAYVALPALPVNRANVLEAWRMVYHQEPPCKLRDAAGIDGLPADSTSQYNRQASRSDELPTVEFAEQVFSRGPNGESPTRASEIRLSEKELEKIREMHATAAIVMHYGDLNAYHDLDLELHATIASASGNSIIFHLVEAILDSAKDTIQEGLRGRNTNEKLERVQASHEAILSCLIEGDADGAAGAMARHIDEVVMPLISR